ncbi:hypothetical protein PAXRUDRAFT_172893 [Paxillus rubicundulus Ve08.2h10]|uniref:Unplaced genomic scaffold scaffold_3304, whole genome shotgun sequence n=1 Tax=Paxillus rubicundulus Ve08.2h10 TaxID=930991 RepID=A0A0D0DDG9_9AGAM|nr:hypothetical protein PAXRUDRAFT_172893 [Paxillus rubicundulus Ve08.2h10]
MNHITEETGINVEASVSGSANTLQTTYCQSAPPESMSNACDNMGLMLGVTYTLSRKSLVSHEEHCTPLGQLEMVEVEDHILCVVAREAMACIKVLEQGMESLCRICEVTCKCFAMSATDFNSTCMGFPFKQEGSCLNSEHELCPAEPPHATSPFPLPNQNPFPSHNQFPQSPTR